MKNAAKGSVRYCAKLFLLTLILTVMSFVTASAEDKMTGTRNFYYQRNGSEIVISNSGKIASENGGTIFIACYDGEVLDCVKIIKADANIDPFYVREFTMKLSADVKNLKVKAFAWDSASAMAPLCDAKEIKYYATAVVSSVIEKDGGIKRIAFDYYTADISRSYLDVNTESSNIVYTFKDTDGKVMTVDDIEPDDVLSIAYNVKYPYTNSDFYDVIVSRKTVEGEALGSYTDKGITYHNIGGNYYVAEKTGTELPKKGNIYRLYIDKNGRFAKIKQTQLARKYAIVERFYTYAGELWVRLVLSDGKKYNYAVEQDNTAMSTLLYDNAYPLICDGKEIEITDSANPVSTLDRFVKYSVSDDGVTLDSLSWSEKASTVSEYNSVSQRIGSYGISSEETVILDATDFAVDTREDVAVIDCSKLDETTEYTAVFVGGRVIDDFAYPMIVLLRAEKLQLDGGSGGEETSDTEMIVAAANVSPISENGEKKNQIKIYTGSSSDIHTEYLVTTDLTVGAGIREGDAFIYTTNSDGEVDNITKIFSVADNKSNMLAAVGQIVVDTSIDIGDSKFYMYPVVARHHGSIALATDIDASYQSRDTGVIETYVAEPIIYAYDNDQKMKVSFTVPLGVVESGISTSGKLNNGLIIDWTSPYNWPAYAVYRMVDGDICELYSISL